MVCVEDVFSCLNYVFENGRSRELCLPKRYGFYGNEAANNKIGDG